MSFINHKYIFISFLFMLMISCNNKYIVDDIEVSELLSTSAREKSINYCRLLDRGILGDQNAIKELSLLEFNDAVGYDHGVVLVDFILKFGEEEYTKSISTVNKEQKTLIRSYIEIGLNYGNNPLLKRKDFKLAFPNLYTFLND